MNTVAHAMLAAAILARKQTPSRNHAALMGAVLPDVSMFVFFAWSRVKSWSMEETWDVQYWTEPWQTLSALSNSMPITILILALAVWRSCLFVKMLGISLLLHQAIDFALHSHDAHKHWWPITDWRFHSPVSYWDKADYGLWGAGLETVCVLTAVIILWQRFRKLHWRILFAGAALLQLAAYGALIIFS